MADGLPGPSLLRALETFKALGIEFVSLSEQVDTSTPTGKMVFNGLRNARAKGKHLGRPRVILDAARIGRMRAQGCSIREIAGELGCSRNLVHKTLANGKASRVAITAD